MPKYYRFRATSTSRKPKRSNDKEKEDVEKDKDKQGSWPELTLACTPAPSWYLRRTSWRESPRLMGLPRQLASMLRTSLQLNRRAMFVFKM
ncbi:uncharacterized protein LOC112045543 [Bicyclus anynana]|uniref:Uncharacterized protein LOC112045543 n=1 Tax=Bicyclus anynana TaxID=110368 RepID=A0A6J1MX65_BICAN|nr:uncharacterized protein LOC112045543 [Bicyclus anynana]